MSQRRGPRVDMAPEIAAAVGFVSSLLRARGCVSEQQLQVFSGALREALAGERDRLRGVRAHPCPPALPRARAPTALLPGCPHPRVAARTWSPPVGVCSCSLGSVTQLSAFWCLGTIPCPPRDLRASLGTHPCPCGLRGSSCPSPEGEPVPSQAAAGPFSSPSCSFPAAAQLLEALLAGA